MKRNQVVPAIVAVAFVLFPLVVRSPYYRHLVILALMWVVIGGSWNLLAGYTGQAQELIHGLRYLAAELIDDLP